MFQDLWFQAPGSSLASLFLSNSAWTHGGHGAASARGTGCCAYKWTNVRCCSALGVQAAQKSHRVTRRRALYNCLGGHGLGSSRGGSRGGTGSNHARGDRDFLAARQHRRHCLRGEREGSCCVAFDPWRHRDTSAYVSLRGRCLFFAPLAIPRYLWTLQAFPVHAALDRLLGTYDPTTT